MYAEFNPGVPVIAMPYSHFQILASAFTAGVNPSKFKCTSNNCYR